MFEQALYIVAGAGTVMMAAALFLKKRTGQHQVSRPQQWERAEVEKSLERFVQQIKRENDAVTREMQRVKTDTRKEVAELRQRLEQAEAELARLTAQVASLGGAGDTSSRERAAEPADLLALRDRYRRAFEWRQQGLDLDEIAKRLGAGRGELELIFSLAAPVEKGGGHG